MSDDELEEILKELEGEEDEMEEGDHSEEDSMEEGDHSEEDSMEEMSSKEKMKKGLYKEEDHSEEDLEEGNDDEEMDLEEIIKALKEEDEEESMEEEKDEDELEEAYNVIKFLRSQLSEVNLLNAKLLYVNKLFKKGELTETKKVKIIETFDRVKTVREAKLVYATLAESMSVTPVRKAAPKRAKAKNLTEGIASSSTKGTKKVIADSNGVYNRFSELINYNK